MLSRGLDGVMFGRAAYHQPSDVLAEADARIFQDTAAPKRADNVVRAMLPYIENHLSADGKLHQITRHMLGLFAGRPGARGWRRTLSEGATQSGAGPELVLAALAQVLPLEKQAQAV